MITFFLILAAAVVIGIPLLLLCYLLLLIVLGEHMLFGILAIAMTATLGLKGLAVTAILYGLTRAFGFRFGTTHG